MEKENENNLKSQEDEEAKIENEEIFDNLNDLEDNQESFFTLLKDFESACKITSKIRENSKKLIMPGASILDIAETIENMIKEEGAKPSFPPNISINNVAAHFTPDSNCNLEINEKDIIKIDLGASVNGAMGDTAYTIDMNDENPKLIEASINALNEVISNIKPGIGNGFLGEIAQKEIEKLGFKPISNLNGHMISRYLLHTGPIIPSIKIKDTYFLKEGDIFAIEPFASTGNGFTNETKEVEIFSINYPKKSRSRYARKLTNHIVNEYFMSPFAKRWIEKTIPSKLMFNSAFKELKENEIINSYPVLIDSLDSFVSQAEHTILVEHDGAKILTK